MKYLLRFSTILLFVNLGAQAQNFENQAPLHRYPHGEELEQMHLLDAQKSAHDFDYTGSVSSASFPDMIIPGEFEESKAVIVTWSKYSTFYKMQTALINAIQQEVPVWIIVSDYSDSNTVKSYMNYYGYQAKNCKFFQKYNDDFWVRDYGPIGFYHNNLADMGYIDLHYYSKREYDDVVPQYFAQKMGVPLVKTALRMEGGNFMTDGFGQIFHSSRVPQANNIVYGWSSNKTADTLSNLFNATERHQMDQLSCDGGTGHIDIYLKLLDEQTFLIADYGSNITASDRAVVQDNLNYLQTLKSTYKRPFKIKKVHLPTTNGGSSLSSCYQLDNDIRGYVNGLLVNKTFIMPTFHSSTSGNAAPDELAVKKIQAYLPGYKIVPIDARGLTTLGGAIHCITIQVPADNPVRFWHPTVEGEQQSLPEYKIEADITNSSGIATALCKWRLKGASSWNSEIMTKNGSTGLFETAISNAGFINTDTVEYYLEATSNNGKTMTKPITAPDGYYRFYFDKLAGVEEVKDRTHLYGAYPNPASTTVSLPFFTERASSVQMIITDIAGRVLQNIQEQTSAEGTYQITIPLEDYSSGVYFYTLVVEGVKHSTRRILIEK